MISVIIVAYNEEQLIRSIVKEIKSQVFSENYELILADGDSKDNTIAIAKSEGVSIVSSRKGKSFQINQAAKIAKGDILFFVHADMKLPANVLSSIMAQINNGFHGGGFENVFDHHNYRIKRTGILMNFRFFNRREQSDRGIFYGDNGIFVLRSVFEQLNGFREIPIMEDYDFSFRLKKKFKSAKIRDTKITVSARRHIETGFVLTRLQWIAIRILYKWGIHPKLLVKLYPDIR